MIDIHCHILPGLDDGAQTLEEAVKMAKAAEEDGIEKIIATPHLFRGSFNYENLGLVEGRQKELNQALKDNNIQVEILAGAEVHISHNLIDEIRKNRKNLVLNKSSYMFVEFPPEHVFSDVKTLFFELMSEGITPIIAHPERNSFFIRNPLLLFELIQMGGLSQANSGSFSGMYGSKVEDAVFRFLELNLIHFIASDGHNSRSKAPRLSEAVKRAEGIIGEKGARALVEENPKAVIDDLELPYLREPVNPEEKERKFRIKIPNLFKK